MPFEDTKILEFSSIQKIWWSTIYYLCKSCLIEMFNRKDWWILKTNPENLPTTKAG